MFFLSSYLLVAFRLGFLASLVLVIFVTVGLQASPVAPALFVLLWFGPLGRALSDSDSSKTPPRAWQTDLWLFVLVALETMALLLWQGPIRQTWALWALPSACAIAMAYLSPASSLPPITETPPKTRSQQVWLVWLMVLVMGSGLLEFFLVPTAQANVATLQIFLVLQGAWGLVFVRLLPLHDTSVVAVVSEWALLHGVAIPVLPYEFAALRLGVIVVVWLTSVALSESSSSRLGALRYAADLVQQFVDLVARILRMRLVWEIVALVSIAILLQHFGAVWYTTYATFPPAAEELATAGLWIVENVIKLFFQLTNNPFFQALIPTAIPEIGTMRVRLYRVLAPIHGPLLEARDGRGWQCVPSREWILQTLLALGPGVVVLGMVTKLFPGYAGLARSKWFWTYGASTTVILGIVSQLVLDAPVTVVHVFLPGSTYRREYSSEGQVVLLALLTLFGSCVILSMLNALSRRHRPSAQVPQTAGRFRAATQTLAKLVNRFLGKLVAAPIVVFAASVLVLVIAIGSIGSPFAKGTTVREKPQPDKPDWLQLTKWDGLAQVETTLLGMIALPTEARLAFLANTIAIMGLKYIECKWGCLCLPDVVGYGLAIKDFAEDAADAIGDALNPFHWRRRRRLFSVADPLTFQPLRGPSGPSRRLLSTDLDIPSIEDILSEVDWGPCIVPDCPSGLKTVCVADLIAEISSKITTLVLDGVKLAQRYILRPILNAIPGVPALDDLLGELPNFHLYEDFSAWQGIDFTFEPKWLGMDWGVLPNMHLPALQVRAAALVPSLLTLIVVAIALGMFLAVAYKLGVLEPVAELGFQAVVVLILSGVVGMLLSLLLFYQFIAHEIELLGREIVVVWTSGAWLYAVAAVLFLLALMLLVAETDEEEDSDIHRYEPVSQSKLPPSTTTRGKARLLKPLSSSL